MAECGDIDGSAWDGNAWDGSAWCGEICGETDGGRLCAWLGDADGDADGGKLCGEAECGTGGGKLCPFAATCGSAVLIGSAPLAVSVGAL